MEMEGNLDNRYTNDSLVIFILFCLFIQNRQVTDTDDADKKKIKIEEASDEIASQANQSTTVHEQESPQNPPQELISSENGQNQNTTLANDSESVAPTSLPPTVITTQRHRMITTTGQIR